tara:strand:- start:315 stop:1013 length:699 start_codon:yes stop_codon:yes gene_type:complete
MANQTNSGSLDTLKIDQTLLLSLQKASNDSYQAVFVERIDRNGSSKVTTTEDNDEIDALATMNYGDSRFQQGSTTYKYGRMTAESIELLKIKNSDGTDFDLDAAEFTAMTQKSGKVVQSCSLNILNPSVQEPSHPAYNMRYRVKLVETHVPNEWQLENDKHKINPSTGETLTKAVADEETGEIVAHKIYDAHRMVFTNNSVKHNLIQHDRVNVAATSKAAVNSFEKVGELGY